MSGLSVTAATIARASLLPARTGPNDTRRTASRGRRSWNRAGCDGDAQRPATIEADVLEQLCQRVDVPVPDAERPDHALGHQGSSDEAGEDHSDTESQITKRVVAPFRGDLVRAQNDDHERRDGDDDNVAGAPFVEPADRD